MGAGIGRAGEEVSVCLIWPKSTFLIDPMVYPPLGLWYVWAALEKKGVDVGYRDLAEDDLPTGYDAYWLSGTSSQAAEMRRTVQGLRNREPGCRIVVGGSHAMTHRVEDILDWGVDVVASGEGDAPGVVDDLLTNDRGGFIYPPAETLDHLPIPVRRAAWRYRSWLTDWEGKKHATTTMFTSRGCPMRCAFCETQMIWGRGVRWVPFETVKREIEDIVHLGFTGIMFYDDIFPLNKPRTLKLLDVLKVYHERDGLIWRCFLRTDVLEKQGGREYLELMRAAGLREVLAGVESGDNRIKDNIRKGASVEQDTQALRWCKELGIVFKASIILGLPGETHESMEATRRWILENRPDRVDVNTLIPFPGTPLTTAMLERTGEFDCYIDESYLQAGQLPEETFYKGPRESGQALVGTSALTPRQIKTTRDAIVKELEVAGIPY